MIISRILLTVLALTAGAACSMEDTPSAQVPDQARATLDFEILSSGAYGLIAQGNVDSVSTGDDPFVRLATNPEQMRELWNRYIGEEPPPRVEFENRAVIFLLLPLRSSGGYSIRPNWVAIEEGEVAIDATLLEPEPGMMTTQALTAPYSVVAIDIETPVESVTWFDESEKVSSVDRSR